MLVAAALFGVGVAIERNNDNHPEAVVTSESNAHIEAERSEGTAHGETTAEGDTSEKVLGIKFESGITVAAAVAASIALAVGLVILTSPLIAIIAMAAAAAFAVFDVAEALHQFDKSNSGLAVLAIAVAALHLAAAASTTESIRQRP